MFGRSSLNLDEEAVSLSTSKMVGKKGRAVAAGSELAVGVAFALEHAARIVMPARMIKIILMFFILIFTLNFLWETVGEEYVEEAGQAQVRWDAFSFYPKNKGADVLNLRSSQAHPNKYILC